MVDINLPKLCGVPNSLYSEEWGRAAYRKNVHFTLPPVDVWACIGDLAQPDIDSAVIFQRLLGDHFRVVYSALDSAYKATPNDWASKASDLQKKVIQLGAAFKWIKDQGELSKESLGPMREYEDSLIHLALALKIKPDTCDNWKNLKIEVLNFRRITEKIAQYLNIQLENEDKTLGEELRLPPTNNFMVDQLFKFIWSDAEAVRADASEFRRIFLDLSDRMKHLNDYQYLRKHVGVLGASLSFLEEGHGGDSIDLIMLKGFAREALGELEACNRRCFSPHNPLEDLQQLLGENVIDLERFRAVADYDDEGLLLNAEWGMPITPEYLKRLTEKVYWMSNTLASSIPGEDQQIGLPINTIHVAICSLRRVGSIASLNLVDDQTTEQLREAVSDTLEVLDKLRNISSEGSGGIAVARR